MFAGRTPWLPGARAAAGAPVGVAAAPTEATGDERAAAEGEEMGGAAGGGGRETDVVFGEILFSAGEGLPEPDLAFFLGEVLLLDWSGASPCDAACRGAVGPLRARGAEL